jgi:hypothetical protein
MVFVDIGWYGRCILKSSAGYAIRAEDHAFVRKASVSTGSPEGIAGEAIHWSRWRGSS